MHVAFADTAFLLAKRLYGEKKALISLFTQDKGLQKGMVELSHTFSLEIGALFSVTMQKKQSNTLPLFDLELIASPPPIFTHPKRDQSPLELLKLFSHLTKLLPERHPYPLLFKSLKTLLESTQHKIYPLQFLIFRFFLLEALGYGLDFTACALSGARHNLKDNLRYICLETGKAVGLEGVKKLPPQKLQALRPKLAALPKPLRGMCIDYTLALTSTKTAHENEEHFTSTDFVQANALAHHFFDKHFTEKLTFS